MKIYNKSKTVFEQELPLPFIRSWVLLEDAINEVTTEQKKNFSSANNKSYNKMKNQSKKQRDQFAEKIDEFRKNPHWSTEEKSESEEEKSEDKGEESDEWGAGKSSSSSSEDIDW